MSVIVENLDPTPILTLHDIVIKALTEVIKDLPIMADGSVDMTGVRITYSENSFLIEKGITYIPPAAPEEIPASPSEVIMQSLLSQGPEVV